MTTVQGTRTSLITQFSEKFSVEPQKLLSTLRDTAFKQTKDGPEVTDAHMMALLVVANQYNLNPFTRELYAFPNKLGGITPIVSIDGWLRIINQHKEFNGVEFSDLFEDGKLVAITCRMFRRDRDHPIEVTEYLTECAMNTDTWRKWPARMLRHKATIQAARYAFGFAGIYDPDEGERIKQAEGVEVRRNASKVSRFDLEPNTKANTTVVDGNVINTDTGEIIEPETTAKGSPAFNTLVQKLNACTDSPAIEKLFKSDLLNKITANERDQFVQLATLHTEKIVSS